MIGMIWPLILLNIWLLMLLLLLLQTTISNSVQCSLKVLWKLKDLQSHPDQNLLSKQIIWLSTLVLNLRIISIAESEEIFKMSWMVPSSLVLLIIQFHVMSKSLSRFLVINSHNHLVHYQTLFQLVQRLLVVLVASKCMVVKSVKHGPHLRIRLMSLVTKLLLTMMSVNGRSAMKLLSLPLVSIIEKLNISQLQPWMVRLWLWMQLHNSVIWVHQQHQRLYWVANITKVLKSLSSHVTSSSTVPVVPKEKLVLVFSSLHTLKSLMVITTSEADSVNLVLSNSRDSVNSDTITMMTCVPKSCSIKLMALKILILVDKDHTLLVVRSMLVSTPLLPPCTIQITSKSQTTSCSVWSDLLSRPIPLV